jgi:hypothetical protein
MSIAGKYKLTTSENFEDFMKVSITFKTLGPVEDNGVKISKMEFLKNVVKKKM